MGLRVFFIITLSISMLFAPFYISIILGLFGLLYFEKFVEAPIVFLFSDLIHGANTARFHGILFVSFLMSLIAFFIIEMSKKKLKFYNN